MLAVAQTRHHHRLDVAVWDSQMAADLVEVAVRVIRIVLVAEHHRAIQYRRVLAMPTDPLSIMINVLPIHKRLATQWNQPR